MGGFAECTGAGRGKEEQKKNNKKMSLSTRAARKEKEEEEVNGHRKKDATDRSMSQGYIEIVTNVIYRWICLVRVPAMDRQGIEISVVTSLLGYTVVLSSVSREHTSSVS